MLLFFRGDNIFNTIRKIKELSKDISENEVETDADGRSLLNISVSDDSVFLSPFSADGEESYTFVK